MNNLGGFYALTDEWGVLYFLIEKLLIVSWIYLNKAALFSTTAFKNFYKGPVVGPTG